MSIPQIKIVMTGPTGVGKTSLLASMESLLDQHFSQGVYKLDSAPETASTLEQWCADMKKLGTGGIIVQDGIGGTSEETEFDFDLIETDSNTPELTLKIFDLPGAYCLQEKDKDGKPMLDKDGKPIPPKARKFLDGSHISFWCVDSVALMDPQDHKGRWTGEDNDLVNKPADMVECIAGSNLKEGHTVIIVLMRAESYEQNEEDKRALIDRLKTEYAKYVLELRKNEKIENVYFCSVQTTGNLLHNGGDATSGYTFVRHAGRDYAPKRCDLPVLCAVRASLDTLLHEIRWQYYRIVYWIPCSRLFGLGKRLKTSEGRLEKNLERIKEAINKKLKDEELFTW